MKLKFRIFATIYLLAAALALVAVYDVDAVLHFQKKMGGKGRLKKIGVEVYWDEALTQVVEEIDWGWLEPGELANVTVWVLNTGNYPHTVLTLSTSNWSPSVAGDYLDLTWDRQGWELDKKGPVNATLTLNVDAAVTGFDGFSFDIVVTAEG